MERWGECLSGKKTAQFGRPRDETGDGASAPCGHSDDMLGGEAVVRGRRVEMGGGPQVGEIGLALAETWLRGPGQARRRREGVAPRHGGGRRCMLKLERASGRGIWGEVELSVRWFAWVSPEKYERAQDRTAPPEHHSQERRPSCRE